MSVMYQCQLPDFAGGMWFWGEHPGFRKYTPKSSGEMGRQPAAFSHTV